MRLASKALGAMSAALAMLALPVCAAEDGARMRGRVIVERDCGSCHAIGATGDSPAVQAPEFRSLGERYDVENLAESLAEGIFVGHPAMPAVAYPPDEVGQVIAYMKSLQPSRPLARDR